MRLDWFNLCLCRRAHKEIQILFLKRYRVSIPIRRETIIMSHF